MAFMKNSLDFIDFDPIFIVQKVSKLPMFLKIFWINSRMISDIVPFFVAPPILQIACTKGYKTQYTTIHCIDVALTDRLSSFLKRQQYFFASGCLYSISRFKLS